MPEQIYIGNFAKGLKLDRLPFNIDNDAFPILYNFYSWRGRIKRKRGTVFLGRLQRQIQSVLNAAPPNNYQYGQWTLVAGAGNLISAVITGITQAASAVVTHNGAIFGVGDQVLFSGVVGMTQINGLIGTITAKTLTTFTVNINSTGFTAYSSGGLATSQSQHIQITPGTISVVVNGNTYTDPAKDGVLVGAPGGSGTINYATGVITIVGGAAFALIGTFSYFPNLPVMGLADFGVSRNDPSSTDTTYPLLLAFDTKYSYQFNQSVPNFFYNTTFYKTSHNPFEWSGEDYQLFWTTNYQGALWATNGKPGFNFLIPASITVGNPTTITTTNPHHLVTGDYVWFNEIEGSAAALLNGLSFQITVTGTNTFTVAVDTSALAIMAVGIFQLLTASIAGQDGIKWYDGDPTGGTGIPVALNTKGWVNFSPPLTALNVSIDGSPLGKYYLVGAKIIIAFKDRLLFFYPFIQTSQMVSPLAFEDTVIWSWNGTPYYTSPVPVNETFDISAYYVDQTGKGGWLSAGVEEPITTVSNNEDVALVGFGGDGRKTRFVYTSNDLQPFLFFNINTELPSSSTFSSISLDKGAIDFGIYGFAITDQQSSERIDLDIPDEVFKVSNEDHGLERVNAIRDYQREWIYFAYPLDQNDYRFPNRTFMYNYRDNTWAAFYENFTVHGYFRRQVKNTWASIGLQFGSWSAWREAWNSGSTAKLVPNVIAGNPQGFVLIKGQGTGEAQSGYISAIATVPGGTQITSIDHCFNQDDYLYFLNVLGTTGLNGNIGKVISIVDDDNFIVDLVTTGTYLGAGTFARLSQPNLQTKEFNIYWPEGRKTRLGAQRYLLTTTSNGQVTLNIYLSQDPNNSWNDIVNNVPPNSLIYSQVLYTCPESTNIGLTPANTNLQTPNPASQLQIWHRMNTSLQGDTIQIGITLDDSQMRDLELATSEIILHGMHFQLERGPYLA